MYHTYISLLCGLTSLLSLLPGKPSPKWQYHLPQGKRYAFHYSYTSEAQAADPSSNMKQTLDVDFDVAVKTAPVKGNTTLLIRSQNVQEYFAKHGDWSPVHITQLPECEVTIDPSGSMVSGNIIRDDTSRLSGKHPLNEAQILDRMLHEILYHLPVRDTFYDGYAWRDTIPKFPAGAMPPPPQMNAAPQPPRTFTSYSVSAGTDAEPRVIWTLTTGIVTKGKTEGKEVKEFSDETHGQYSFEDATGMIAGYQTTTETHRGGDTYKTTKTLTMRR